MADEYYERYKHLSHQELYRMLHAGSPNQVDTVADNWASIGDTVNAIAATLQHDLKRLLPDWTSQGSREFHYRLDLIARYAQMLADEAGAMRTGLTVMASSLRETQRRAESPPPVTNSMFGTTDVVDGVVGTNMGRVLPSAERAQAHERMVRLIARLAAEYGVADHRTWPVMLPEAPIDLPAAGAIGTGLASGAVIGTTRPRRDDHGRRHDRDRDRDRGHGHGRDRDHGHGERHRSSTPGLGSLGSAVIGSGSGWAQYGRPVHLAGHAIGVDLSASSHTISPSSSGIGSSGGSGNSSGSGNSGGGGGSGGSGSGGSSAAGASGGSGGASMSGGGTGAGGAGGAGAAMPMAPMGGVAPAAGVSSGAGPGPALGGGGGGVTSAERAWHAPDPVDWADPDDDAAPSVLGD